MSTEKSHQRDGTPWAAIALMVGLVCATCVVWVLGSGIARAHGGGIEAEVIRRGTAHQLTCSKDLSALSMDWVCSSRSVSLTVVAPRPSRVQPWPDAGSIYSKTDVTGQDVQITTHLPSQWQTGNVGQRSLDGPPVEIAVVEGHPVGSAAWDAFRVFAPFVLFGTALGVLFFTVKYRQRSRYSRRRRRRGLARWSA